MTIAKNDGIILISLLNKKKNPSLHSNIQREKGEWARRKARVYRRMPLDNVNRMLEIYNHQFVTPNVIIDSSQDH